MSKNKLKILKKYKRLSNDKYRLSVYKSNTNIYAQIIDDEKNITLVSVNSLKLSKKCKLQQAEEVGINLANSAKKKKITDFYLDRGKLRYTGRLKKFCEAIRENGINF